MEVKKGVVASCAGCFQPGGSSFISGSAQVAAAIGGAVTWASDRPGLFRVDDYESWISMWDL